MLNPKLLTFFGLMEVTFDQLPEQIREYYIGPRSGLPESHWLTETRAVLQFTPVLPYSSYTNFWKKPMSGEWVLVMEWKWTT